MDASLSEAPSVDCLRQLINRSLEVSDAIGQTLVACHLQMARDILERQHPSSRETEVHGR